MERKAVIFLRDLDITRKILTDILNIRFYKKAVFEHHCSFGKVKKTFLVIFKKSMKSKDSFPKNYVLYFENYFITGSITLLK